MLVFFVFFKVLKHFRPENPGQRASANSPSTHLCLSHSGKNHLLPHFSFCISIDCCLNDGQGGQLTPRAVPRLRGGLPWREEADFDTFYMAFRFDLGGVVFVGGGVGYGKGAVGGVGAFDILYPHQHLYFVFSSASPLEISSSQTPHFSR